MKAASLLLILTAAASSFAPAAAIKPLGPAVFKVPLAVRQRVAASRIADLPMELRQRNWGGGSCVHATMVYLFHWQGRHDIGEFWRKQYSGGETIDGLVKKFDANGYKYSETRLSDESFLEASTRTRHGCGVVVSGGSHMIALVGLSRDQAHVWDSNSPEQIQARDRDSFIKEWKQAGGWAITPLVGNPSAPRPFVVNFTETPQ